MKPLIIILILAALGIGGYLVFQPGTGQPESSVSPSPSVPSSATPTPSASRTPTPSASPASSPSPTPSPTTVSQRHVVLIRNFSYQPANLTVKRGDTITFMNEDQVGHSATSDTNAFNSGILSGGSSYTLDTAPLVPGAYPFHCIPHPYMQSTLTIQ